jgi:hypothetical protein
MPVAAPCVFAASLSARKQHAVGSNHNSGCLLCPSVDWHVVRSPLLPAPVLGKHS